MPSDNSVQFPYKTFGEYVRICRTVLKLSQADIGKAVGVDRTTVMYWESGRQMPNFNYALGLLRFLQKKGAPPADIYRLK